MTTKARRAPRKPPARLPTRDLLQLAFHAGAGLSSNEIAEVMGGGMNSLNVRYALRKHGIRLRSRNFDNDALTIRWKTADTEALTKAAFANDLEVADCAIVLLRVIMAEPVLLKNLLDEVDQIDDARHAA